LRRYSGTMAGLMAIGAKSVRPSALRGFFRP
jgi:hypothetical protein